MSDTSFVANDGTTEMDYTVVSRIPGPNNTEQFLFFSNHDIGVMATVEFFTNEQSIEAFTKKYLNDSPHTIELAYNPLALPHRLVSYPYRHDNVDSSRIWYCVLV